MLDVIVVGGGPAGSAAAAVLARRGCRVLVLDRARFPRVKPCGDYLNAGCGAVLGRIGVRPEVERAAIPVPGMRIFTPDGTAATTLFSAGTGYALPRETLDHLLLAHAARMGASVLEETRVTSVVHEGRHVRVSVERGRGLAPRERYRAHLVIGADGLHSTVARMIGAEGSPRGGRFTVGAYLEGLEPFERAPGSPPGELHLGGDRYCGVACLPGGLANVTVALTKGRLRTWRGNLEAHYWGALRTFPGLTQRLARARRVGAMRTSGPLAIWRRRVAADGVLLTGDAAAFMDPMTGQGVYLALRGGELAADAAVRALDGGGPAGRTLAGYDRARRREFGDAFLVSRALQYFAFRPLVIRRAVREMATRPDLGTWFIDAVGNVTRPASMLRLGFLARLLGGA